MAALVAARFAFKVAYDGARFHGSQRQPGLRTVDAALSNGLEGLGIASPTLSWAGRTDAGVSAAGNVVVLDEASSARFVERFGGDDGLSPEVLTAWTHQLADAWVWAWARVPLEFWPRHAHERHYRYRLRTALDVAALQEALTLFVGRHDFSSFARVEPGAERMRTVTSVSARQEERHVVLEVKGLNFLHNQVRRMVEAARRVVAGEASRQTVLDALAGKLHLDLGLAPADPLVLVDVHYRDVDWHEAAGLAKRRVWVDLQRRFDDVALEKAILQDIVGEVEEPF